MALTTRKQAFADALLAGKTKTQAAILAGLSAATASQSGSRLAKDKHVLAYMRQVWANRPAPIVGYTLPSGEKSPDAPAGWPFGTVPQPGAAQTPAAPEQEQPKRMTAREYLANLVNDTAADEKMRLDAAKKLIEFEEAKPAPIGKKEAKTAAAGKVAGRFAAAAAPLKLVGRA